MHGKMELIGVIENLKSIELDKLKTKISVTQQISPTFDLVDETESMDAQEILDSVNPDDYPDEEDDPIKL